MPLDFNSTVLSIVEPTNSNGLRRMQPSCGLHCKSPTCGGDVMQIQANTYEKKMVWLGPNKTFYYMYFFVIESRLRVAHITA